MRCARGARTRSSSHVHDACLQVGACTPVHTHTSAQMLIPPPSSDSPVPLPSMALVLSMPYQMRAGVQHGHAAPRTPHRPPGSTQRCRCPHVSKVPPTAAIGQWVVPPPRTAPMGYLSAPLAGDSAPCSHPWCCSHPQSLRVPQTVVWVVGTVTIPSHLAAQGTRQVHPTPGTVREEII